jgi:hypothetical protein
MKSILSGMSIALIALSLTSISAVPSVAQSTGPGPGFDQNSGPDWRRDNGPDWNDRRRGDRNRGHFERRGNYAYFNNHRGFKNRHPGYGYYNGFWFPPAAFIVGAIVGGAFANSQGYSSSAHIAWCETRYQSYHRWDNTYQPFNGPRQVCVSPYYG